VIERPSERAAAAIIRAWIEPGEGRRLRVRVTEIVDPERGETRVNPVVTSIEEACAIVGRWLDQLVESAGQQPQPGPEERGPRR
jgi:hypothetical protein